MKTAVCIAAAVTIAALWSGLPEKDGSPPPIAAAPAPKPFVVHEWGTFTSFHGADGVALEGVQHEVEELPAFVHAGTHPRPSPFRDIGDPSRWVKLEARTKMETPVLYFYSELARDVEVEVGYRGGWISHAYPAPDEGLLKPRDDLAPAAIDYSRWSLSLHPDGSVESAIPELPADDHYGQARRVNAVTVRSRKHGETDRFVFYRGLGSEPPKIQLRALPGDELLLSSEVGQVPAAFAVEIGEQTARFVAVGSFGEGEKRAHLGDPGDRDTVVNELAEAVERALVRGGLYEDEARAMVATWRSAWFGDVGHRLLYIVPKEYVNTALPLSVTPTPDRIERVFVGRLEYLPPEREQELEEAVRDSLSLDQAVRQRSHRRLAARGRFLESSLRRVLARATDPALRNQVRLLLAMASAQSIPSVTD